MEGYTPKKVAELVADLRARARVAVSHEATDALNAAADALTAVSAERDRLHKGIAEVREWWYSAKAPRVRYSDYLRVSAILRAALGKEGQADE